MKKLSTRFVSAFAALTLLLSACGGGTESKPSDNGETQGSVAETSAEDSKESGSEAETSAAANGEAVEITLMQSKTEIQSDLETVVKAFNEKNPDVKVNLLGTSGDNYSTVLQSAFAADPATAPTIFSISGPAAVDFEKFYLPLGDTEASKKISEGLKAEVTSTSGDIIGLPGAVEGYGFIYNKALFEKAGVDPASVKDIDAFVKACEALAKVEGVEAPIGFAQEEYFVFVHFFNWAIALDKNFKEDMKAVNEGTKSLADLPTVQKWAEALDKIAPFTNKGQVSYDEQVAGFGAGKYAMIHQGNWAQQVLEQNNVDFEYAFLPYPMEGNEGIAVGTASAWRVNNGAGPEQQAAAKKFLDWLILSEDGQNYSADLLKFIPAYTGVKAPAGGLSQSVAEYVSNNKTVDWAFNSVFPSGIEVDGAAFMQDYYAGSMTSADMLQQLAETWKKLATK